MLSRGGTAERDFLYICTKIVRTKGRRQKKELGKEKGGSLLIVSCCDLLDLYGTGRYEVRADFAAVFNDTADGITTHNVNGTEEIDGTVAKNIAVL